MQPAGSLMTGMHDFAAFAEKKELKKSTKVLIHKVEVFYREGNSQDPGCRVSFSLAYGSTDGWDYGRGGMPPPNEGKHSRYTRRPF